MSISRAFLTTAAVLAGLTAAHAREDVDANLTQPGIQQPGAQQTAPVVPADPWTADKNLRTQILQIITARKMKTRDADMSGWLDELGTVYSADFKGPLWLEDGEPSKRAHDAIDELRRADEWGLVPADYDIELPTEPLVTDAEQAQFEVDFTLNVLKYVDHARRGRFRPTEMSLWYERASNKTDHIELLQHIALTDSLGSLLTAQHPQHEGFKLLRKVYLQRAFPGRFTPNFEKVVDTKPIVLEYGKSVRRGQRDPQIALLRKRLKVPAESADDQDLYDRIVMNAVNRFMRTQGWRRKHVYDDKVRRALNEANGAEPSSKSARVSIEDLVANMEKWRWLPRELGNMYVWNNLPTFKTQVVKNDRVIHEERIIIGKPKTQTPVFSDTMTHVVFKPQWGVPSSIKVKTLLPRLASGDLDVLRRRGMRIQYGDDKVVSPSRFNWSRTDINTIPIVMGAGSSNPLGRVKFMFPNHHSVYMHDTPDRHLFKSSRRLYSHGCIRVRDPIRFAEIILGETTNWSGEQVQEHLARRARDNNRVDLAQAVNVHNTYFTVIATREGKLETLPDIYGHDKRIKQALAGKSLRAIASSDPARIQKREIAQLAKAPPIYRPKTRRTADAVGFYEPYGLGGPGYYVAPKPKKKHHKKKKPHSWTMNPYQNYFSGN